MPHEWKQSSRWPGTIRFSCIHNMLVLSLARETVSCSSCSIAATPLPRAAVNKWWFVWHSNWLALRLHPSMIIIIIIIADVFVVQMTANTGSVLTHTLQRVAIVLCVVDGFVTYTDSDFISSGLLLASRYRWRQWKYKEPYYAALPYEVSLRFISVPLSVCPSVPCLPLVRKLKTISYNVRT